MKTILLSVFALGMFAAPALAENATNDTFGGRAPFFAVEQTAPVAAGVDYTATAAIPSASSEVAVNGERSEIVYNRYNR
jgi:hypothetical protein